MHVSDVKRSLFISFHKNFVKLAAQSFLLKHYNEKAYVATYLDVSSLCELCRRKFRHRIISSVVDCRRNPLDIRISSVVDCLLIAGRDSGSGGGLADGLWSLNNSKVH